MRFLLDESVEARIGTFLTSLGHDAIRIGQDILPPGLPDPQVLAIAHREQRILITNDRDFGELVFRRRQPHAGVIYLRFPLDATAQQKIEALTRLFITHAHELDQQFIVVTPGRVRLRKR